ncbi:MAG TPA: DUF2937 family protein [Gallionella sp.]
MSILYRYLIVVIACIALLVGMQIPNFVDQYHKRLDAHLREVTVNLQPFQEIADKYLGGDLTKLVELNRKSDVRPLQEEGAAIEAMMLRKLRFEAEITAMQTSLPMQALHILLHADREILDEARTQYSYTVPINPDALMFGGGIAILILAAAELLFALARIATVQLWRRLRTSSTRPSGTP